MTLEALTIWHVKILIVLAVVGMLWWAFSQKDGDDE